MLADDRTLGGQRMARGGAFVDDLDPVRLEIIDVLFGIRACGLDDRERRIAVTSRVSPRA